MQTWLKQVNKQDIFRTLAKMARFNAAGAGVSGSSCGDCGGEQTRGFKRWRTLQLASGELTSEAVDSTTTVDF
jgi:hypothetical protein